MNTLDLVLIAAAIGFAILGWRLGLVRVVMSLLGIVIGAGLGLVISSLFIAPSGLASTDKGLLTIALMVIGALVVQFLLYLPNQGMHAAVDESWIRRFNQALGSVLSLGLLVGMVWAMATAFALLPSSQISAAMRGSTVLVGLDQVVPADAGPLFNRLQASVVADEAPRVFTGLGLVPLEEVTAPPPGQVSADARNVADESVVRIIGTTECGDTVVGSGVVVAPQVVLTNAHVVAGMERPLVRGRDDLISATGSVVAFDPAVDLALIRVPKLNRPVAKVGPEPAPLDLVAVSGFPGGAAHTVIAAAVRGVVTGSGEDIYGTGQAQREVLVLSGQVEPGSSGGPVLNQRGEVVGIVFAAASPGESSTGFAISAVELQPMLSAQLETDPVDVGGCLPLS